MCEKTPARFYEVKVSSSEGEKDRIIGNPFAFLIKREGIDGVRRLIAVLAWSILLGTCLSRNLSQLKVTFYSLILIRIHLKLL